MRLHYFLICLLLVSNVVLRTLTNQLNVLPKVFNVADIPLVLAIFLVSLTGHPGIANPSWTSGIGKRLAGFLLVVALGCVLNSDFFYVFPAGSQLLMLTEPLLLFLAVVRLPFAQHEVDGYLRLLRRLIWLEVILGFLQLPGRIQSGETEWVHGTFPGNAEQYAAFLMIASFYFIAQSSLNPHRRRSYIAIVLVIQLLNISIDNKASWLGTAISLTFIVWRLGNIALSGRAIIGLSLLLATVGLGVGFVATKISTTMYKYEEVIRVFREGEFLQLGKLKAYSDIVRSGVQSPHMLLVGSGLSTFYSRASRQFYLSQKARDRLFSNPGMLNEKGGDGGGDSERSASDSMGGVATIITSTPYYQQFYGDKNLIHAIGSHQVDQPFSPYAGLFGETGLIGLALYLGCYLVAFRRLNAYVNFYRDDPQILTLGSISLGLMIYFIVNSLYGPFLETTRMTTILWSLIGLVVVRYRWLQANEQWLEAEPVEGSNPPPESTPA